MSESDPCIAAISNDECGGGTSVAEFGEFEHDSRAAVERIVKARRALITVSANPDDSEEDWRHAVEGLVGARQALMDISREKTASSDLDANRVVRRACAARAEAPVLRAAKELRRVMRVQEEDFPE